MKPARPRPALLAMRLQTGKYRHDAELGLEKRCATCGDYYPADTEFFFAGSDGDGLHCSCKDCHKQSYQRARQRRRALDATT